MPCQTMRTTACSSPSICGPLELGLDILFCLCSKHLVDLPLPEAAKERVGSVAARPKPKRISVRMLMSMLREDG